MVCHDPNVAEHVQGELAPGRGRGGLGPTIILTEAWERKNSYKVLQINVLIVVKDRVYNSSC